jgi:hypothetical protein
MTRYQSIRRGLALIISVPLLVVSGDVFALDNTIVPSIHVAEKYNDNILFERSDQKDDFITTIHPRIGFFHESEITNLQTILESYLNYYAKEKELNDQSYRGELALHSKFLERWNFGAKGEYVRDTTLESQLLETGRVFNRDDRDQFTVDLRGGCNITELSSISVDYKYRQVEYKSDENVNFNDDTITVGLGRRLKNQIDFINIFGRYGYNESREREIDTYNFGVGWQRELTDIYSIKASGGYRISKTLTIDREEKNTDGLTFDIGLSRQGETYNASIGYRRGLTNAASGEYLEYDRIYGSVQRRLSERSKIRLNGSIVFSRDDSDIAVDNNRYFQVEPQYAYNVTENSEFSLGYRYSQDYDDGRDDKKSTDRSVIWIDFRVSFPQKL